MDKRTITQAEIGLAASRVADTLLDLYADLERPLRLYGVPRGGIPALYAVACEFRRVCTKPNAIQIVEDPRAADAIIDDLVDSGKTRDKLLQIAPQARFLTLYDKQQSPEELGWLVFPWEGSIEYSAGDIFTRLIEFCGEDVTRGGLVETPARMVKAWQFWTQGYQQSAAEILKTFEDGGENYDEMIHQRDIPFYSQCEHHLAPFFGTVTFAYIPGKRIVGLSKMNRLVDVFARRLQVQERLTVQVVNAFCEVLSPRGAAITIQARHLCMESRGVCQQGMTTTTSALRGVFKEQPAARAEFFSLSNK
jgi:GTP cyclohydrolase IA